MGREGGEREARRGWCARSMEDYERCNEVKGKRVY